MLGHVLHIGFPIDEWEDFERTTSQAMQNSEAYACDEGRYLCWSSEDGAELWVYLDQVDDIRGMVPHFRGPSVMRVGLSQYVESRNRGGLFGWAMRGWANPAGDDPERGDYPFAFALPDGRMHADLELPCIRPVQLCAFACDIKVYESEEAYRASGGPMAKSWSIEAFMAQDSLGAVQDILSGAGGEDTAAEAPPDNTAIISGRILEMRELSNPLTGAGFYAMRVKTLGGEMDLVAAREIVNQPPVPGGIVWGTFSLSGWIMDPEGA